MGKNTIEAKQWLYKRYGGFAPGTNTDDVERSGHPKSAVVPENITKVHKIVLGDSKLKLREIAATLRLYVKKSISGRIFKKRS